MLVSPRVMLETSFSVVARVDTDYLLFVRPEVDIQPGDTVVVTRLGKQTVALAGLAPLTKPFPPRVRWPYSTGSAYSTLV